ncbi:hypothetical protein [Ralstonia phage RSP15]|uniref:hypothetical protein n=1 Tax=Ralstonia phage RSP15 TaxID=1785960 RepID=UPI00074D3ED3|nr:hypothetical protein BH754_gp075 [Ralstonia phage RSP15]BAU40033.1 hypothetical protein [Ralstonia phage RSP15]
MYCNVTRSRSLNSCCYKHDEAYGPEGTGSRLEADRALRDCIRNQGHPVKAQIYYIAVRLFGWIFFKR